MVEIELEKPATSERISYREAIARLRAAAGSSQKFKPSPCLFDLVPLASAIGRVCAQDVTSTRATPTFDTSAMDGYAIQSHLTTTTSNTNPLDLEVVGISAAGDPPLTLPRPVSESSLDCGPQACVQIMTGAQFPILSTSDGKLFDACVKWEDVETRLGPSQRPNIRITAPVTANQNRRFAGSDFSINNPVISRGDVLGPQHIMALASLGIASVKVEQKRRIAVLATGSELSSPHRGEPEREGTIPNSNGPFLLSALQALGRDRVEITDLGTISDDGDQFKRLLTCLLDAENGVRYDMIITTGAVSKGKFDFIRDSLEERVGRSSIVFHGVGVRPGAPILFATLPNNQAARERGDEVHKTAFFGLPGNPLATVVGFRFFVTPYVRFLHGLDTEKARPARLCATLGNHICGRAVTKPAEVQIFHHGTLAAASDGSNDELPHVTPSPDQASYKMRPLLSSNCWVSLPPGKSEIGLGMKWKHIRCYHRRCSDEVSMFSGYWSLISQFE